MKKTLMKLAVVLLCMTCSVPAMAQFNLKKSRRWRCESCKGSYADR